MFEIQKLIDIRNSNFKHQFNGFNVVKWYWDYVLVIESLLIIQ